MSVAVVCPCGNTYELRDEFAGMLVECPSCGASQRAGGEPAVRDDVFDRDLFLMRQAIAVSERYQVSDDQGNPLLFVERPAHFFRNLIAVVAGVVAGLGTLLGTTLLAANALQRAFGPEVFENPLIELLAPAAMLAGATVGLFVGMLLSKKRHVTFYRGTDRSGARLLEILQNHKVRFPTHTFTVLDGEGRTLGVLSKNYLYNLFRKQWGIAGANGRPLCVVREDSIILSLLRRFLGPLFGLLRTNFVFYQFGTERELGEFKRKLTLLDKYVFDMSPDRTRSLDRRLAVAAAVMLDSAERR